MLRSFTELSDSVWMLLTQPFTQQRDNFSLSKCNTNWPKSNYKQAQTVPVIRLGVCWDPLRSSLTWCGYCWFSHWLSIRNVIISLYPSASHFGLWPKSKYKQAQIVPEIHPGDWCMLRSITDLSEMVWMLLTQPLTHQCDNCTLSGRGITHFGQKVSTNKLKQYLKYVLVCPEIHYWALWPALTLTQQSDNLRNLFEKLFKTDSNKVFTNELFG